MSTTAKISWVDGALFVAEGGSGHTITMDGAPDVGGRNLAARPMEVVLMGMGGCTAIDVVAMLADFLIIAVAEQYFSSDRLTARSTSALFNLRPRTV